MFLVAVATGHLSLLWVIVTVWVFCHYYCWSLSWMLSVAVFDLVIYNEWSPRRCHWSPVNHWSPINSAGCNDGSLSLCWSLMLIVFFAGHWSPVNVLLPLVDVVCCCCHELLSLVAVACQCCGLLITWHCCWSSVPLLVSVVGWWLPVYMIRCCHCGSLLPVSVVSVVGCHWSEWLATIVCQLSLSLVTADHCHWSLLPVIVKDYSCQSPVCVVGCICYRSVLPVCVFGCCDLSILRGLLMLVPVACLCCRLLLVANHNDWSLSLVFVTGCKSLSSVRIMVAGCC